MRCNPLVKQREAELAFRHRFHHELEGSLAGDVQIESVHQEKRVSGGKPDPFVAIQKCVIIDQRLQQGGRLFAQVIVVARLRTENRSFQCALIQHPVLATVFLNLVMVDGDDFSHG